MPIFVGQFNSHQAAMQRNIFRDADTAGLRNLLSHGGMPRLKQITANQAGNNGFPDICVNSDNRNSWHNTFL